MLPALIPAAIGLATQFGPGLVRLLAGDKAGEVAEQVVSVAQEMTGAQDPDHAMAILEQNPELAAQVRMKYAEIELEYERMHLQDVQDARSRDVRLAEMGQTNWRAHLMVGLAFLTLITCITLVATLDLNETVRAMLNTLAGGVLGLLGLAFNFEFGSSRGSKDKDVLMRQFR